MITYVIIFAAGWALGHFGHDKVAAFAKALWAKFQKTDTGQP